MTTAIANCSAAPIPQTTGEVYRPPRKRPSLQTEKGLPSDQVIGQLVDLYLDFIRKNKTGVSVTGLDPTRSGYCALKKHIVERPSASVVIIDEFTKILEEAVLTYVSSRILDDSSVDWLVELTNAVIRQEAMMPVADSGPLKK